MHKITIHFILFSFFIGFIGQCHAQFSGLGSGTEADPYQVATADQLNEVREYPYYSDFIQTADIDLNVAPYNTGKGWAPIENFSGSYNGNGYKITGLYINAPDDSDIGLFGDVTGELTAINLEGVKVTGFANVGGLVGFNSGTITKCYVTGTISGTSWVGGLVGYSYGSITNSYSTAKVSGIYSGGLIGEISKRGIVINCYATGAVSGSSDTGGFTGLYGGGEP